MKPPEIVAPPDPVTPPEVLLPPELVIPPVVGMLPPELVMPPVVGMLPPELVMPPVVVVPTDVAPPVACPLVPPASPSEDELPSVEPVRRRPEELQAEKSIPTLMAQRNGAEVRRARRWGPGRMRFFARILLHVDARLDRICCQGNPVSCPA
jgi:hypothetical protein